jgi:hypothetical protein
LYYVWTICGTLASIRQVEALSNSILTNTLHLPDVHLVRDDSVPMEDVLKIPTAFQIDEYMEYKRLRKVYREKQRKGEQQYVGRLDAQPFLAKVAPPISPLTAPISSLKAQSQISSNASRSTKLMHPVVMPTDQLPSTLQQSEATGSPGGLVENGELSYTLAQSMLGVPVQKPKRSPAQSSAAESHISDSKSLPPTIHTKRSFDANSGHSHGFDIREVAPWIDSELAVYERPDSPRVVEAHQESRRFSRESAMTKQTAHSDIRHSPSPQRIRKSNERKRKNIPITAAVSHGPKNIEGRNPTFARSRNPIAKLFDGTEDTASSGDDYFSSRDRASSVASTRTSPFKQREPASSSHEAPLSPIPLRPISPSSPLLMGRRDAICLPYGYVITPGTPTIDIREHPAPRTAMVGCASQDGLSTGSAPFLPLSLRSLITKSKLVSALTTPTSPRSKLKQGETEALDNTGVTDQLRRFVEVTRDGVGVLFKNPFQDQSRKRAAKRSSSADVAPDVIVKPSDEGAME